LFRFVLDISMSLQIVFVTRGVRYRVHQYLSDHHGPNKLLRKYKTQNTIC